MKGRKLLVSLLAAIMVIASSLFVVSCKKDKGFTAHGEEGVYYAYDNSGNEINALLEKGTIAYTTDEIINGTYSYDGKTFTYTIGESTQTADYDGNTIRLTVNGQTRIFYRKSVKYSVKYHVDGNVYKTDSVTNGNKAVRPDDPVKSGSKFIGWYETNDYKNVHNFAALVTENVDLYGYFVDNAIVEYSVTLNAEGTEYDKQRITTTGGVIRDLPVPDKKDGKNFSGWYVSDYNSADKLTYKYDGRQLSSDVELFAAYENGKPEVTLDKNGKFTWKNKAGVTYTAEVFLVEKSGEKSVHTQSDMTGTVEFDFGNQPAGDYRISVKEGENETSVYYKNKALARVSGFKVVDNKTLIFNSVENAAEYKISVDCGTSGHVHEKDSLGKNTVYNFASCGMKKGGIEFTVYAVADGYLTSESKYVFERSLEGVADVKYEEKTGYIVWTRVDNAVSYEVSVAAGKESPFVFTTNETRYSLKKFTGEITVKVTPVTDGFNSPEAVAFSFTKNTLSTPSAIRVANNKITWDAVNDASSYVITVNGAAKTVTSNEYALSQEEIADKATVKVTVQAIHSSVIGNNSFVSDEVLIGLTAFGAAPVYDAGVVTWSPVAKADKYVVNVNGGRSVEILDGSTSLAVTLTQAGENEITVSAYSKDSDTANSYTYITSASAKVTAYKVTFDVRGGTDVENQYYAYGDVISLPTSKFYGYDLIGMYDVPGGAADNGSLFVSGSKFLATSNVTLYAYWSPAKVTVNLELMGVGELEEKYNDGGVYSATAIFDKPYTLPVPVEGSYVASTQFGGWYTERGGKGERYTNENGNGYGNWLDARTLTLYAAWYETLSFRKVYNSDTGKTDGYSVSSGPDIGKVTTIKIPAYFSDGNPIVSIEADAFKDCKRLVTIEIPDNILNVDTGYVTSDGVEISAFSGCASLEEVNVYKVDGNHEKLYSSEQGILFRNDPENGKELKYIPQALAASDEEGAILKNYKDKNGNTCTQFTVPTGVTSLPLNAFKANSFTRIMVPYTVTNIEAGAFSSPKFNVKNITEIYFTATPADKKAEEKPLVLASTKAFNGCNAETIILPSRIAAIDFPEYFGNCPNLVDIGFTGDGGNFEVCYPESNEYGLAPEEITVPDGTDTKVRCGIVVDKTDDSAKKIVYCPIKYECKNYNYVINEKGTYAKETATGKIVEYKKDKDNTIGGSTETPYYVVNSDGKVVKYALESVNFTVPEGITEIGKKAFLKNQNLTSLVIAASVEKINEEAFSGCSNITSLEFLERESDNAHLEICAKAFYNVNNLSQTVIFPSRTAFIGGSAFYNAKFGSVVFNSDDKSDAKLVLDEKAFDRCTKIASVTFGSSLSSIGAGAFSSSSLKTVVLDCDENAVIANGAFFNFSGNASGGYVTDLTIGKNVPYMDLAAIFSTKMTVVKINAENPNYTVLPAKTGESVTKLYEIEITETTGEGDNAVTTVKTEIRNNNTLKENERLVNTYNANGPVLNGDGKVFVLYPKMASVTNYAIPATVEKIASGAFATGTADKRITGTLTIGNNVTEIGEQAFINLHATKIEFAKPAEGEAENPLVFGKESFKWLRGVTTLTIPKRTVTIGEGAFRFGQSQLKKIIIDSGKVTDESGAVSYTSKLTAIESNAFYSSSFTEIELSPTVQNIGMTDGVIDIFGSCSKLETIKMDEGGEYYGVYGNVLYSLRNENGDFVADKALFIPQQSNITEVVIKNTITELSPKVFSGVKTVTKVSFEENKAEHLTEIADSAFEGLTTLKEISIPEGVTRIGSKAFYGTTLTAVEIPSTVNFIGTLAFASGSLSSLETVTFRNGDIANSEELVFDEYISNGSVSSDKGVFYKAGIKKIVFPNRPISLGGYTFKECANIESVTFKNALTKFGTGVFQYNSSLKEVIGLEKTGITEIPDYTFYISPYTAPYVGSLKNITIPDTVTTIGVSAFQGQSLTEIRIPANVTYIGQSAFSYNADLASVVFAEGSLLESFGINVFDSNTSLEHITLPEGVKKLRGSMFNKSALKSIVIPASVESLTEQRGHSGAFSGAAMLKEITFAKGSQLKLLGKGTFAKTGIEKIEFPDTDWEIEGAGDNIFDGCANLTEVYIAKGITDIESSITSCPSIRKIRVSEDNKYYSTDSVGAMLLDYNGLSIKYICGVIDSEIYELPEVSSIGDSVFKGQWKIRKLIVPESIRSIGMNAFEGCISLEEIEFKKNGTLISIGSNVFKGCDKLISVNLPESLTKLDASAFKGSSVQEVYVPSKIKSLGVSAFDGVSTLSRVTGMRGLTEISDKAFKGTSITVIEIPESVTSIGESAFEGCKVLTSVKGMKSVETIGKNSFKGCSLLMSFAMPEKVREIPEGMFYNCTSLSSVTGLEDITTVNNDAFNNTQALKELSFPEVMSVGMSAFNGSGIASVSLPKAENIKMYALRDCKSLSKVVLCDVLTALPRGMFAGCESLKSVTLPKNVSTIGDLAFVCSGIETIVIPAGVTDLPVSAFAYTSTDPETGVKTNCKGMFENCKSLKSVTIEGDISAISEGMFRNCVSLESFDLSNIASIGTEAFYGSGIKSVNISKVSSMGSRAFGKCLALTEIIGAKVIGENAFRESGIETLDLTGVTSIGTGAFAEMPKLTSVTISGSLTTIAESAFFKSKSLETVTIGEGVTAIGSQAFYNCSAITEIVLPETLNEIGESAFAGTSLTTVALTKNVNLIGKNAFNCATLTAFTSESKTYTVQDGVLYYAGDVFMYPVAKEAGNILTLDGLKDNAFNGNKKIKKVVLTNKVTEIPDYAFYNSSIEEIEIPASVGSIGQYAFHNCNALTKVTFLTEPGTEPGTETTNVDKFDMYAFGNCANLAGIDIPSSVTSIGNYCFTGSGIREITIPEGCETLNTSTFANCLNLEKVTILSDNVTIGRSAFEGCVKLKTIATSNKNEPNIVNLPAGIKVTKGELPDGLFSDSGIEKIVLPAAITSLACSSSDILFENCAELREVVFEGKITEIGSNVFRNCAKLETLDFSNSTNKPDGTIVLPDTLTTLGAGAFANTGLKGVVLSSKLSSLGNVTDYNGKRSTFGVFEGCKKLTNVTVNSAKISGGKGAFIDCTALTTVIIDKAVKTLPEQFFEGCTALNDITFGGLTAISSKMFAGCTSLTAITIPGTITRIGGNAFNGSGLTSITFSNLTKQFTLDNYAFGGCDKIKSIVLPKLKAVSITTATRWFEGCTMLESVEFSDKVDILGEYTFNNCTSLTTVKFGNTPEGATGIYIPENMKLGNYVFNGISQNAVISVEKDYYYTVGIWGANWYKGCNADIYAAVKDPANPASGIKMNPYFA